MKKLITYLFVVASASLYAAEQSLVDLDSSNASNSSIDTYYKWNAGPDSIAIEATINFTESNLGLFANRDVRDFKGTINLAADTSGNIMAVGNTTQNVLGFGSASIVGENTNTSFTITAYHGDEYQTGYYRFTSATALSIYKATVTFTDTDIAYTGSASSGKTSTIAVEEGGTIVWNIGGLRDADVGSPYTLGEVNDSYGLKFSSADKTGKVVLGADAAMHNYSFSNVAVSFADDVSSTVNLTSNQNVSITDSTISLGDRNLNITSDAQITLSNAVFDGNGKGTSIVNIEGASFGRSPTVGGHDVTVNLNTAITGNLSIDNASNSEFRINADSNIVATRQGSSVAKPGDATIIVGENVNVTTSGRLGQNYIALTLEKGATLVSNGVGSSTSTINGNNIMNYLTIAEDAKFTLKGGIRFAGGTIDGSLVVDGQGSIFHSGNDSFIIGFSAFTGAIPVVTFGANSSLLQHNTNPISGTGKNVARNWVSGSLTMVSNNTTQGALDFGNRLYISKGAKFVLNTTDAYIVGSNESWKATSQATSLFHLESYQGPNASAAGVTFEINALNNIGGFVLNDSDSKLILEFGSKGVLILGEDTNTTSLSGDGLIAESVVLSGDVFNQFKIYDLTEDEIRRYFTSDGENSIYVVDAGDGSYWVNTVIPEPAEWAALLGALVLGLAVYRRRK